MGALKIFFLSILEGGEMFAQKGVNMGYIF